jgi:hypothetical protein
MNLVSQRGRIGRCVTIGLGIAAIMLFAGLRPAFGQQGSEDRDNPTELTWETGPLKVSSDLDGSDTEQFYSLAVKPGKLTFTFDVKASGTNAGAYFDVFGKNSRALLSNVLVQGIDGGSDRVVKTLQIGSAQTIVIRVKGIRYGDSGGTGTFAFAIKPPATAAKPAARAKPVARAHAHFVRRG